MILKNNVLTLNITSACNMHCHHCLRHHTPKEREDIYLDPLFIKEFLDIYQSNPQFKFKSVAITGGEALLHPDLEEIIRDIEDRNIKWSLVTNGLLKDRLKDLLYDYHRSCNFISFSLDGANPIDYQYVRGGSIDNFSTVIDNIKEIRSTFPRLFMKASHLLNGKSYRNLNQVFRLIEELKLNELYILGLIRFPHNIELSIFDSDVYLAYEDILNLKECYKDQFQTCIASSANTRAFQKIKDRDDLWFCDHLRYPNITLDYRGNINFCCDAEVEGNVIYQIGKEGEINPYEIERAYQRVINNLLDQRLYDIEKSHEDSFNCNYCIKHLDSIVKKSIE